MDELESKISSLLSSPDAMQQLMDAAKQLMPQLNQTEPSQQPETEAVPAFSDDALPFDPGMLQQMMGLISQAGAGDSGRKAALISALKPFLSEKRQNKLTRAMSMMRMVKAAKLTMGQYMGGDKDV